MAESDGAVKTRGYVCGDPDFKAMMDEYEAFFDEYVEFMQAYSENPTSAELMGQYSDLMSQYAETMNSMLKLTLAVSRRGLRLLPRGDVEIYEKIGEIS